MDVGLQYKYVDGYHVFTSTTVYGLYVASKDLKKACGDIAPSINKLAELNSVEHELDQGA